MIWGKSSKISCCPNKITKERIVEK